MNDTEITKRLAGWTVDLTAENIPASIRAEGVRTFVNWLGCAVGGASHETVDRALDAVRMFSGPERAQVIGRTERLDELHAALVNGISSHVLDYDDTHLKTIIHPAGPVASAILAVSESRAISGRDFLTALIAGIEVECRIGNSVYPDHYDRGWHITGTAGVFGAAAATGKLLGLTHQQMVWAFGIAATQSSGLREMFGTMCKSFHPGRAAQNGAMAAFLAKANFDSSERAIEAPRGFANVLSTKQDYSEIMDGLGDHWEAGLNTYKPFACGIVIHPTIDGCQQLREQLGAAVETIRSVELRSPSAGARTHRQDRAEDRPRRQVQRVPRGCDSASARRWLADRLHRRGRARSRHHGAARQGQGDERCGRPRGRGSYRRYVERRKADRPSCCRMPSAAWSGRCPTRRSPENS